MCLRIGDTVLSFQPTLTSTPLSHLPQTCWAPTRPEHMTRSMGLGCQPKVLFAAESDATPLSPLSTLEAVEEISSMTAQVDSPTATPVTLVSLSEVCETLREISAALFKLADIIQSAETMY